MLLVPLTVCAMNFKIANADLLNKVSSLQEKIKKFDVTDSKLTVDLNQTQKNVPNLLLNKEHKQEKDDESEKSDEPESQIPWFDWTNY